METRRQLAIQRKAEEEKAKALEGERKLREEVERRKREREELTDKRPIKSAANKKVGTFLPYNPTDINICRRMKT